MMEPVLMRPAILVSCEHATAHVPPAYAHLFKDAQAALATHRAWDPGAWDVARAWAGRWDAPLFGGAATRLLCDLNRSPRNPALWSDWTRALSKSAKAALLRQRYYPYRQAVATAVAALIEKRVPVLHLSVHSFTPVLRNTPRNMDLGLLYDPSREAEAGFADSLHARLLDLAAKPARFQSPEAERTAANGFASLRIARNKPYRGVSDGLVGMFRGVYPDTLYLGMEIEFNQALLEHGPFPHAWVAAAVERALAERAG